MHTLLSQPRPGRAPLFSHQKNNKDILRTPVKYFLSEMNVRSYLPNDLDIAAEDRPRTFMILSSRGAFFVRTGTHMRRRSNVQAARPARAARYRLHSQPCNFQRFMHSRRLNGRAPHRDAVLVCSPDRPGTDRHPEAKRTFDPSCPHCAQVGLIRMCCTFSYAPQDFMYRVELEGHKVNLLLRRTSGIHLLSKDGVRTVPTARPSP